MNELHPDSFPLVTVITLSYNSPDLHGAIKSVLEQTYPKIEYLIIDDCSNNFSDKEIKSFISKHQKPNVKRVQVTQNDVNRGTVYTANLSLHQACGEYIFFLAGDDQFNDSQVIADWVKEFLKTGAQVITAYREIYDEKLEKRISRLPDRHQVKTIYNASSQELFEKLAVENFIFGCCTAYQRQLIESLGYFDERYRLIEDWPFLLKVLRSGIKIYFFSRSVVKYRSGGTSSTGQSNTFYQTENQKIMEQEALPFSQNPVLLQKKYKVWKKEQEQRCKVNIQLKKYANTPIKKFFVYVWFFSLHPWKNFHRILRKPRRYYSELIKNRRKS